MGVSRDEYAIGEVVGVSHGSSVGCFNAVGSVGCGVVIALECAVVGDIVGVAVVGDLVGAVGTSVGL